MEILGLTEDEEKVYRAALRWHAASIPELKRAIGMSDGAFRAGVLGLEEKGLLSRSKGSPRTLSPSPPDIAIEALVHKRQEELDRARTAGIRLLEELKARAGNGTPDIVDVVRGREAVLQRWNQLQRSARDEVLAFDAPPYFEMAQNEIEMELLNQGVKYRVVYATGGLEIPDHLRHMFEIISAGEESRVIADVPMKLDIADHTLALVPLELDEPGVESALMIRRSPLLEALRALFETFWERAVPVRPGAPITTEALTEKDEPDYRLLALLAAGFQDKAIARQLDCSLSTVRRRVADLMKQVGAQTRFQVGLQAAKRGWL